MQFTSGKETSESLRQPFGPWEAGDEAPPLPGHSGEQAVGQSAASNPNESLRQPFGPWEAAEASPEPGQPNSSLREGFVPLDRREPREDRRLRYQREAERREKEAAAAREEAAAAKAERERLLQQLKERQLGDIDAAAGRGRHARWRASVANRRATAYKLRPKTPDGPTADEAFALRLREARRERERQLQQEREREQRRQQERRSQARHRVQLSAEWWEYTHFDGGRPYYHNTATGKSQWHKPAIPDRWRAGDPELSSQAPPLGAPTHEGLPSGPPCAQTQLSAQTTASPAAPASAASAASAAAAASRLQHDAGRGATDGAAEVASGEPPRLRAEPTKPPAAAVGTRPRLVFPPALTGRQTGVWPSGVEAGVARGRRRCPPRQRRTQPSLRRTQSLVKMVDSGALLGRARRLLREEQPRGQASREAARQPSGEEGRGAFAQATRSRSPEAAKSAGRRFGTAGGSPRRSPTHSFSRRSKSKLGFAHSAPGTSSGLVPLPATTDAAAAGRKSPLEVLFQAEAEERESRGGAIANSRLRLLYNMGKDLEMPTSPPPGMGGGMGPKRTSKGNLAVLRV